MKRDGRREKKEIIRSKKTNKRQNGGMGVRIRSRRMEGKGGEEIMGAKKRKCKEIDS